MANLVSTESALIVNNGTLISRDGFTLQKDGPDKVVIFANNGVVSVTLDYKRDTVDGESLEDQQALFDLLYSFLISGGGDGDGVAWANINDVPDSLTSPQASGTPSIRSIGTGATQAAAGNHTHAAATTSANGFMSSADKTKLDGVATGATANDTDANLLNRSNHTGTQAFSTISGTATTAQIPNLAANKITALTGYAIGTAEALAAADSLNAALGKLEARLVALETAGG